MQPAVPRVAAGREMPHRVAPVDRLPGHDGRGEGLEGRHEPAALVDGDDRAPGDVPHERHHSAGRRQDLAGTPGGEVDAAVAGSVAVGRCAERHLQARTGHRPEPLAGGQGARRRARRIAGGAGRTGEQEHDGEHGTGGGSTEHAPIVDGRNPAWGGDPPARGQPGVLQGGGGRAG